MKQTSTPAELAQALEEWAPKFEAMMNPGHVHPYAVLLRTSAQALRQFEKVKGLVSEGHGIHHAEWCSNDYDDACNCGAKELRAALKEEVPG